MSNEWKPEQIYKRLDLHARHERALQRIRKQSDQEVVDGYRAEMLKLKALNRFGRQSEQFQGYPNTAKMNQYRRELEHRGLPIPEVSLPEKE
jgi:hypothetical protein